MGFRDELEAAQARIRALEERERALEAELAAARAQRPPRRPRPFRAIGRALGGLWRLVRIPSSFRLALGAMLEVGRGTRPNPERARVRYDQACRAGLGPACLLRDRLRP